MIHIDAGTLRRQPILGVLLGGAVAAVVGWLLLSGMSEARALLRQRAPDVVSLHEIVNQRSVRWVTLAEGKWHCDHAITMERSQGVERWVLGRVESSEVPITGETRGELLVASFDGDVSCVDRAGSPLMGVVGSTEIFGSRSVHRRWERTAERVAVLNVGASPRQAMLLILGLVAIGVLGLAFAGYYLRLVFRARDRHPAPVHSMAPIQPS